MPKVGEFARTDKQMEIMRVIFAAADAGELLDFVTLKDRISYGPTVSKQTIWCSVYFLIEHGMIDRKYGFRRKVTFTPSVKAYQLLRSSGV